MRKIEEVADTATEGLKGDRELRLDVRRELISHIMDSFEERVAGGLNEDESLAQSIKAFGPAPDIAAELVSANRFRMRLRHLVRLALRGLLVPASLAVALWIFYDFGHAFRLSRAVVSFGPALAPALSLSKHEISEDARFLMFGDASMSNQIDRQRSIWEKDPTNRVFYGNYITILAAKHPLNSMEDIEYFEKEIRRGEALDPDNARYNYLLASVLADFAAELVSEQSADGEKRILKVRDRELLDSAMQQMLKGGSKPFMDTYSGEMQALRFAALPEADSFVDVIGRIGYAAGMLLPDVSRQRNLARTASEYSKLLIEEGRKKDALAFLETWYPLARKSFEQDGTLIESLVSFAIMSEGSNSVAMLKELGVMERAEELGRKIDAVNAVREAYRAEVKSGGGGFDEIVERHGGILHGLLLPAIGGQGVTKDDLEPGRRLEQTLLEQGWLAGFIAWSLLLMLGFAVTILAFRFIYGRDAAPVLLLPDVRRFFIIILYSVILPLGIFFVYTRYTGLAGRDLSMRMWPRFVIELHLLMVVMLSTAAYQLQKFACGRCRQLGVEVPRVRSYPLIFLLTLIPAGLVVWLAAGRKNSSMFRGSIARSFIPVMAVIIVLVGLLSHTYLLDIERRCVQNDAILGIPDGGGFTCLEAMVTKRLNKEALAVMGDK